MPRKGQKLTAEQKAKMQAGRKSKKTTKIEKPVVGEEVLEDVPQSTDTPSQNPLPSVPQVDPNVIAAVVVAVQELQKQNPQLATADPSEKLKVVEDNMTGAEKEQAQLSVKEANQARVSKNGVQGIVFRYPIEKSYYADPTPRLFDEPKLARFALRSNYIFKWSVEGETFEKNGVTYSEPRFIVELFRRLWNDDGEPMRNPKTGNPVMALIARHIQHEDEMTTRVIAQRQGILEDFADDAEGFRKLMDEIRYYRIQQWLFAIFTPPKIKTFRAVSKTQVLDGKVVEVFDTEELTDHDTAQSQASILQSQTGVGGVSVPHEDA